MTSLKRVVILGLAGVAILCVGELATDRSNSLIPSLVSSAEARVGRPLTPVSVAGAARRTTRRCAAGVYDC